MKKLICAAALIMAATSLPAQDKLVTKAEGNMDEIQNFMANKERSQKETDKMNAMMEETMTLVTTAISSPETKKKLASAWNIKGNLHKFTFSALLDKIIAKEVTDTAKLAENLYASLDAKEKCYLAEKDVKEPKFFMANKLDVVNFRQYIAYCGQFFYQNGQMDKAIDAYKRWLDYPKTYSILGSDAAQLEQDEMKYQIAFNICLLSYNRKDYKTVMEYMPIAQSYTDQKNIAQQILMQCHIEQGDTAAWLAAGKKIVLDDPNANEGIAQNLLAYYFNKGQFDTALAFTEEILAVDAESRIGNYSKGLVFMNNKDYEKAIAAFDHAGEVDPTFSDAFYNAGVCYSNMGYNYNESLSQKKMTPAQNKIEIEKVKDYYAKAEPYFLKVRELEPDNSDKWASRLRTVYYILGDKAKEKEMNDILGE